MPTLLLRLAGPMQSWGTTSRFDQRDTGKEPSKSGVIGLLAAASGIDRENWTDLEPLARLAMGVRHDRPGLPRRDYQTAGCAAKDTVIRADGSQAKDGGVVSERLYLADAVFLVALEGEDRALLKRVNEKLKDPAWPLSLGRKSYVPSESIWLDDVQEDSLRDVLTRWPWIASPRRERPLPRSSSFPSTPRMALASSEWTSRCRRSRSVASGRGSYARSGFRFHGRGPMFLHRIHLNPRCREARRDLSDPYQLHSSLCRAFSAPELKCPQGEFLWRLEPETNPSGSPRILVQSRTLPDWHRVGVQGWFADVDPPIDLEARLHLESQEPARRFRFRLRANPCVTRNGKRLGLLRAEEQEAWLERKGMLHGFSLPRLPTYGHSETSEHRADVRISKSRCSAATSTRAMGFESFRSCMTDFSRSPTRCTFGRLSKVASATERHWGWDSCQRCR